MTNGPTKVDLRERNGASCEERAEWSNISERRRGVGVADRERSKHGEVPKWS